VLGLTKYRYDFGLFVWNEHRVLDVGHNVPQEAPQAFAQAVIDADRL
jgi:pimeloyl-ACP methyl ester carboxylesterase